MRRSGIARFLPSYYAALALPLLMGAAFALRFYGVSKVVLSPDECFSWRLTQYPMEELVKRTAADVHPPLYYLLLKAWCAAFGTSPAALRGLSAVLGVMCIPIIYAIVQEARMLAGGEARGRGAALFAAFLVAVHTTQVVPGSTARMYALGVSLCGMSAWLLLKALASGRRSAVWWSAYGLSVAASCYTHYYAFFSIFAQAVFVGLWLFVWRRSSRSSVRLRQAAGFLFAAVVALLLYLPWLPILWQQTHDVHGNYWISPVTGPAVAAAFFSWGAGLNDGGMASAGILLASLALAAAYGIFRGGPAAWFFLLQASIPWGLSLGLSLLGGRSIFVERYLLFAHLFFLGFVGVLWSAIPSVPTRVLAGCWIASVVLWGSVDTLTGRPESIPPVACAMKELRRHYAAGDLVLGAAPTEVNRLRYYAGQAGLDPVDIRCVVDSFGKDKRFSHIAALTNQDIVWGSFDAKEPMHERVWLLSEGGAEAGAAPRGMRKRADYHSEGTACGDWTLTVYARE